MESKWEPRDGSASRNHYFITPVHVCDPSDEPLANKQIEEINFPPNTHLVPTEPRTPEPTHDEPRISSFGASLLVNETN